MADIIFHNAITLMAKAEIDFDTDTFKCALVKDTYTPDADHTSWAQVSGSDLATGYGYTAGGETVSGITVTDDDTNNKLVVDIANVTWSASGASGIGPARYGVIYDDTHASDALVYLFDFGANKTADSGTLFKIIVDANGLFTAYQS